MKRRIRSPDGQVLLIAVLLFSVLLIAIPSIIFFNQINIKHVTASQNRRKVGYTTQEGIAYGIHQLSSSTLVTDPAPVAGTADPGPQGGDNCAFVSQTVPTMLKPNQIALVRITFQNKGSTIWSQAQNYRLGATSSIWGLPAGASTNRVEMTGSGNLNQVDNVSNPNTKTFSFFITAPATAGTYNLQMGMFNTADIAFGQYSSNVPILVQNPPASPPNWPYFSGSGLPPIELLPSIQSGKFSVAYTSAPSPATGLFPYQVGIRSQTYDAAGNPASGNAVYGVVSRKTLAVTTPSGMTASLALAMMQSPINMDGLVVHWGPVAIFESSSYPYRNAMDTARFPRKFSTLDIWGVTYTRSGGTTPITDGKEFWANTDLGFANPIDLMRYQQRAQASTANPALPTGAMRRCPSGSPLCGYFSVPEGQTAILNGYTFNASGEVIIIEGNAQWDTVSMNLGDTGAFIVNGDLTLNTNPSGNGQLLASLRVPPTSPREYPYAGNSPVWPCHASVVSPGTCASVTTNLGRSDTNGLGNGGGDGRVHFRGFLYVTGNVTVLSEGWLINGAVRIDGRIDAAASSAAPRLTILYDDIIAHNISTTPFELKLDDLRSIP